MQLNDDSLGNHSANVGTNVNLIHLDNLWEFVQNITFNFQQWCLCDIPVAQHVEFHILKREKDPSCQAEQN